MEILTIKASVRELGNKQSVKQIRRAGLVPCVVYGCGIENINFTIDAKDLKKITYSPKSYLVKLQFESNEQMCVMHQIQYHPVTDEALHVDFLAINETKPVVIAVPVTITGNSEGVKQGGKLQVSARKLKIAALQANLPDELKVDITTLGLGKTIVAGDLNFENVQMVSPKGTIVCAVKATRASKSAEGEEAK